MGAEIGMLDVRLMANLFESIFTEDSSKVVIDAF